MPVFLEKGNIKSWISSGDREVSKCRVKWHTYPCSYWDDQYRSEGDGIFVLSKLFWHSPIPSCTSQQIRTGLNQTTGRMDMAAI